MAVASCAISRWFTTNSPNNPKLISGNTMLLMFTNKIHPYRCNYQHDISRFCFVNSLTRIPWSWSNDPSLVYWKSYLLLTTNPSLAHKHPPPQISLSINKTQLECIIALLILECIQRNMFSVLTNMEQ